MGAVGVEVPGRDSGRARTYKKVGIMSAEKTQRRRLATKCAMLAGTGKARRQCARERSRGPPGAHCKLGRLTYRAIQKKGKGERKTLPREC